MTGLTLVFAAILLAMPAFTAPALTAQTVAAPVRPTSPVPLVPAPAMSPVVHPDGSVTFTLSMPHAEHVEVQVEGFPKPFPMARATPDGDWTYTLPPVAPEFYSYSYLVDGTAILDPRNVMTKPSHFVVQSVFLVPGHKLWEVRDVPHGTVSRHEYTSAIVKRESPYYIYTPPGFNPADGKKYPVLYLLHGYSDEPSAWTDMGKADVILDNLLAEGNVKPMIVVMPLGYGDMDMINRGWAAWSDPDLIRRNFTQFGEALFTEVMPRVNAEYPLSTNRDDHAIAGLSMGGAETLLVGLNHPRYFAWIGSFSAGGLGAGPFQPLFPDITPASSEAFDHGNRLLWISVGTEDGLLSPNRAFIAWLKEQGLHPDAIETPGMHAWMVWRDNLTHFLPLLFQPKQ
jgi:enterochelin esterase-like enzyme